MELGFSLLTVLVVFSKQEGTPLQQNESDKAALAAKIAAKQAAKVSAADAEANKATPVQRKVKPKKDAGLDDLLNAGLAAGKKGKK